MKLLISYYWFDMRFVNFSYFFWYLSRSIISYFFCIY